MKLSWLFYIDQDVADDQIPDLSCIAGYGIGLDLTARDIQNALKPKECRGQLPKAFAMLLGYLS